ncbi:hypothetical protein TWF106_000215 [Orbilia oligospora]|uniref:Uncharacterized protein n=1 Tax=Orbilia oligospora TaxID=2813651 RepID=A0A7C8R3F3_ORBOL|nr:hypothetical protein TWF106_000215 [Orbilia oligospora]
MQSINRKRLFNSDNFDTNKTVSKSPAQLTSAYSAASTMSWSSAMVSQDQQHNFSAPWGAICRPWPTGPPLSSFCLCFSTLAATQPTGSLYLVLMHVDRKLGRAGNSRSRARRILIALQLCNI